MDQGRYRDAAFLQALHPQRPEGIVAESGIDFRPLFQKFFVPVSFSQNVRAGLTVIQEADAAVDSKLSSHIGNCLSVAACAQDQ
jgi:hypothetical protein